MIWNEVNVCLNWDSTLEWFELLGMSHPKILYDGIYDEKAIRLLYDEKRDRNHSEGYVLRVADSFSYGEFRKCVAKYVRAEHIQTAPHNWLRRTDYDINLLQK